MPLTHDEFFDAFQGKNFRLKTVCLFQKLIIRKSCFLERLFACWVLRKLRASPFASRVLTFLFRFRSESAPKVFFQGTIRLDSQIRSQIVHFYDSFWREQNLAATKASILRNAFLVGPYAFIEGPYAFF